MAGEGDRGGSPQQGAHPRMGAGLPAGPGARPEGQKGVTETAREMASGAREAVGQVRERAQEYVSGTADRLEGAWRSTREGLQEGASTLARQAENFWNDTADLIRRYPVASVAIAFGLGFLASSAMAATYSMSDFSSDDVARRMSRASE
jgi:ElaB/YqjD/DUF883 family membrane-anchored ribosome-binding protein